MNFNIVEGEYYDFDSMIDDFEKDYLASVLTVKEIQAKYELSRYMYSKLASEMRKKHNLVRRPVKAKYYHKHGNAWVIVKDCGGKTIYFGRIPIKYGKEVLEEAIAICKSLNWNISECKGKIKELKDYAKKHHQ